MTGSSKTRSPSGGGRRRPRLDSPTTDLSASLSEPDSLPITLPFGRRARPGRAIKSASAIPASSDTSGSSDTPSSPTPSPSTTASSKKYPMPKPPNPKGYESGGDSPRERLLALAGLTEPALAEVAKQAFAKKVALLDATQTEHFSTRGKVHDQRVTPDYRLQLDAAKALDDVLGLKAPPARQTVTVLHKLELPEWMMADGEPAKTIEIEGTVEP